MRSPENSGSIAEQQLSSDEGKIANPCELICCFLRSLNGSLRFFTTDYMSRDVDS